MVVISQVTILLLVGAALTMVLISSVGAAVSSGPLDRLHFLGPAGLMAPLLLAAAWTVQGGQLHVIAKCWLTALFVVLQAPVLTHVAAHAKWRRRHPD